jgi:predicted methyltransferase
MRAYYQSIAALCLCAGSLLASAAPPAAAPIPAYVSAAVDDNTRPGTDKVRDVNRLPGETIAFAGVKPGDMVGELLPGGGYYTRVFARWHRSPASGTLRSWSNRSRMSLLRCRWI